MLAPVDFTAALSEDGQMMTCAFTAKSRKPGPSGTGDRRMA